ncbi:MAG: transcriptional repressor [Sedimentisphaerales bacterium]|jgi:Fur family peroxide stress response transcriptional regulator|nr:transcriptional repressor [Sedimentisphaerales bacterium]NLZ07473.1 transcriptional repressor [Phycisphaerae bacterium]HNY79884.1 transcriptional repressor [Sedimentisphaerales bacterium]HOC64983.1 transcriptional repressor [Sedimentisphaerales bacterium]HOH63308.1 transcriptional repressor [Sedimentisphaerales bacterium]
MAVSKAEIERRMKRFAETCRTGGLKTTHQRMEVFRELAGAETHPDAETIYRHVRRRVPAISRDTVYRTLATLEEQGLVHKAEIVSGRGRYDANMEHHHHFICTACGRVHDFYSPTLDDLPIPKSVSALGRVESTQVQLRGLCTNCAKDKR